MTRYSELSQDAGPFLALTGYTVEEFLALLPYFVVRFEGYVSENTLKGKKRQKRRYSTYATSPLPSMEDKLLFILSYLKTATLQAVQGQLFNMQQPVANHWIHCLLPLVQQALADAGELPARDMDKLELEEGEAAYFWHDGTERPIQRPKDPAAQSAHYSGKKKQHTLKNDVIINQACKIIFLTDTVEGKKHDKKLADEAGYTLPKGSILLQDTGFQGFALDNVLMLQPKKKPRGRELSPSDKARNRWIASLRMRIEHAIGGVKRYRMVKDKLRLWKKGVRDLILAVCCGLHNFRLNFRPWHYDIVLPSNSQITVKSL